MLTTRVIPSTRRFAILAALLLGCSSVWGSSQSNPSSSIEAAPAFQSTESEAQRQQMLIKLQKLERDNERLRQQLERVEPSENVAALQQVLESHTRIIERLRQAQTAEPKPGFDHRQYDAPAAQGSVAVAAMGMDPEATAESTYPTKSPAAASVWALEVAGASGVLALIGALILLFVITVLRKSYWMPRQSPQQRPAAKVSKRGLADDLANDYRGEETAESLESAFQEIQTTKRQSRKETEAQARQAAEMAKQDQVSMARMLEQGLQLDGDDLDLFGDSPSTSAAAKPLTAPSTTKSKSRMPAAQRDQGEGKNPRANEYDLLGSDSAFDESNEFDELFEAATQISEAKSSKVEPVSSMSNNDKKLFDEEMIRRIRQKTFDYVPPVDTEGYIVEEGCDDLDKYMDIEFIAPPKVQMCDAKEQRDRDAKRDV